MRSKVTVLINQCLQCVPLSNCCLACQRMLRYAKCRKCSGNITLPLCTSSTCFSTDVRNPFSLRQCDRLAHSCFNQLQRIESTVTGNGISLCSFRSDSLRYNPTFVHKGLLHLWNGKVLYGISIIRGPFRCEMANSIQTRSQWSPVNQCLSVPIYYNSKIG